MTKPASAPPAERVSEIEDAIAAGTMSAAQVFTQMRQLLAASAQVREVEACVICCADEPYTGTCGSSDPRALCNKPAPESASVAQESSLISRLRIIATDYAPGSILRNTIEQAIAALEPAPPKPFNQVDFFAQHFGDYWVIQTMSPEGPMAYAIRVSTGELLKLPDPSVPITVFTPWNWNNHER